MKPEQTVAETPGLNEARSQFAEDVKKGLTATPKFLSSKYFYDKEGDRLFQEIMNAEEYYLTRCEHEILETHKPAMLEYFSRGGAAFDLIEFGAGDGAKTKTLIGHFLQENADFEYLPIDISSNALQGLATDLNKQFPRLRVESLCGDYFERLSYLNRRVDKGRKVVLFLGSNIGNFSDSAAVHFLSQLHDALAPGDLALIGFDLAKDPEIILKAYNDSAGITRRFNLNLLGRINRELHADFDPGQFQHYPLYDPEAQEARSYLISLSKQKVYIGGLDLEVRFDRWESIFTEISKKYSLGGIDALARKSGFRVAELFFDKRKFFVDALFLKQ